MHTRTQSIDKEDVLVLATQSCPTLCNHMDCSPPGSSVHGIFQARILEWVAISFSRGLSWPRDWTWVSCTAGRLFTDWAEDVSIHTHTHTHTHTRWSILFTQALKKEWNNAIWSNIDRPRDYHTKWSQRKTNIIRYHLHVESKKMIQMNLFTKQK